MKCFSWGWRRRASVPFVAALVSLAAPGTASASGWHDYHLEIAPGFTIWRMNSFEVCLAGPPDDNFLVCPDPKRGVGPLIEYAVTETAIFIKSAGATPHERNPSLWQGDRSGEFFYLVIRADQHVAGPLTRKEWEQAELPDLASINWVKPKNPNFWTPLLGNLMVVGFMAASFGWPVLLLGVVVLVAIRLIRRRGNRVGPM